MLGFGSGFVHPPHILVVGHEQLDSQAILK